MPATTVRSSVPTVERATLGNGLRVVLAPDRSSPVVAVAVYYDVGIRSEPEGRTGRRPDSRKMHRRRLSTELC